MIKDRTTTFVANWTASQRCLPEKRAAEQSTVNSIRHQLVFCCFIALTACASPVTQPKTNLVAPAQLLEGEFIASDNYKHPILTLRQPPNPTAVVIALHGFNDYSIAFNGMCSHLVARDIACYAYDQRGFGKTEYRGLWPSEGKLESDLAEITALLRSQYPNQPIFVAGESMGGAVIISTLSKNVQDIQTLIDGTILFAPAVWGRGTQPWYQRMGLTLAVNTFPSWQPTGEGLGILASDNIDALRVMGMDPLIIKGTRIDTIYGLTNLMDEALLQIANIRSPLLMLYGANDEVIPKKPTCLALTKLTENKAELNFQFYENGYHMLTRDLQASTVFNDVFKWISTSHEAPIPSSTSLLCEQ